MSVYQEFCDFCLHRAFPLIDAAGAKDITDSFQLPTSLICDVFLCVPNLPVVDAAKFYISNILVRRYTIDIDISYDDPATPTPIGAFKNINTAAALFQTYAFTPYENQTVDIAYRPLYFGSGQIVIGDPRPTLQFLGSWHFQPTDDAHSTLFSPARICKGAVNLQYIYINDRLFTGKVQLKEGTNLTMDVVTQVIGGAPTTIITFNANPNFAAVSDIDLNSDTDVLNALIAEFGRPINTINGLRPDGSFNFNLFGVDCTTVATVDHGLSIGNPCATPCCNEDNNVQSLVESVANLNLRYAQLKAFLDATGTTVNNLQNKLLVLGAEV